MIEYMPSILEARCKYIRDKYSMFAEWEQDKMKKLSQKLRQRNLDKGEKLFVD